MKQGIFQAGGTPVEFGVMAPCDGIAQGHAGMHYILPSRDLIANDVEMMVQAHRLDAIVLICSCDKIVPGMLMAAARLDLPAIIVVGGPMEGGCSFDERAADTTSLTEGLGMLKAGTIDEATYRQLEDCATPTCGSCAFLGTANHECAASPRHGDAFAESAHNPATYEAGLRSRRRRTAHSSTAPDASPRADHQPSAASTRHPPSTAIGGSTNVALHPSVIAYEAGEMSSGRFERCAARLPSSPVASHLRRPTCPTFTAPVAYRP